MFFMHQSYWLSMWLVVTYHSGSRNIIEVSMARLFNWPNVSVLRVTLCNFTSEEELKYFKYNGISEKKSMMFVQVICSELPGDRLTSCTVRIFVHRTGELFKCQLFKGHNINSQLITIGAGVGVAFVDEIRNPSSLPACVRTQEL